MVGRFATLLLLASQAVAGPTWRQPSAAEIGQKWRDPSPHRYAVVSADLDGDGMVDRARLMVATSGSGGALVVELGGEPPRSVVLERDGDPAWLNAKGVDAVRPGEYRTACGKGYWACGQGEPEVLTLSLPAIEYFTYESASSYFLYDGAKGTFQRVWISD